MNVYNFIGYTVQAIILCLGIIIIYNGSIFMGLLLSVASIFGDVVLRYSVKKDSSRAATKTILLTNGVILWLVFLSLKINDTDTTIYTRTHNLISSHIRSKSSLHHMHPTDTDIATATTTSTTNTTTTNEKRKRNHKSRSSVKASKDPQKHRDKDNTVTTIINQISLSLLIKIFGQKLPDSDFSDLKYRDPLEVRNQLARAFSELPLEKEGFLKKYKNPCWRYAKELNSNLSPLLADIFTEEERGENGQGGGGETALACLPYAYILGQPKCGTSDLFERLKSHNDVRMPHRKEVRWFTRGEFTTTALQPEGEENNRGRDGRFHGHKEEYQLSPHSSIFSYTNSFDAATRDIYHNPEHIITIDGGPHTLWWPTQQPDSSDSIISIPTPQMIREIQPMAKFIITLSDPVKRLYSDYYFLNDDRSVARSGNRVSEKSSKMLHLRIKAQVNNLY